MVPHVKPTLVAMIAGILILAIVPGSAAQSSEDVTTDVTFFGHIFGFGRDQPMPMNTQFPHGEADYSIGQFLLCGQGIPDVPNPQVIVSPSCGDEFTANEEWWYTTAGFVQIKNFEAFDYEKLHNERGLTKDTRLDTSRDIVADFYMSADAHAFSLALCTPGAPRDVPWPVPCWNWDPGYLHQWQVEATVYTGVLGDYGGEANKAPDIAGAFASGKLNVLARGLSPIQDVKSLEAAGNPTVWKFPINLGKPQRASIAKEESYVVRFKWWSVGPNGPMITPEPIFNINSGEYYPPLITIPVKGAFTVEYVIPQFVYEKLVILGIMNTPWGSYDVDQDSIKLTITDKNGAGVTPVHLTRLADFSVAHGGHYKPVNVTYVWDYKADKLAPGEYTATVSASNYQGSASAECAAKFVVLAGGHGGDITIGQCGVRTISDQQLDTVKTGSQDDAKSTGGTELALPPAPAVRLSAVEVAPVPAPSLALLFLPALLAGIVLRRWAK